MGNADIDGTGNAMANVLYGNVGNNSLDGGAAVDILHGGAGDDIYFVDAFDTVVEEENGGHDTVRSFASIELAPNVEDGVLTGDEEASISGNEMDNRLQGNAATNWIDSKAQGCRHDDWRRWKR